MIRTATIDDLDGIMAIENASFPSDAWSENAMRAELEGEHGHYVVLVDDGRIAGYAGLRHLAGGRDSDVQTIAVSADARGAGHGRALLTELLSTAVARRAREVFLEVRADNPVAEALYSSEGFVEIGRRERYYQPDDIDAVVMKLDLRHRPHEARRDDEPR
ncbi:MAG: ribosomal protein S18-alanine N-acetyltransferase [Microbacterium gubbeenense]|uniref:ribosomal protein S18-alanine N-acetyltransferase n=1 Tax=Microbacterium gubbeenense TaxID=159896 RepID=UPI000419CE86